MSSGYRRAGKDKDSNLLVGANQIKNENNKREENATKEGAEMRRFIRIVALGAALVVSGSAFAQQYPSKPVKIIVPFPPAGVTDIVGRLVAQKMSEKLGEQFYIENIAGAGGNLGMGQAARSPGDGYTILFASSSIVVNPTLYSKVPFDVEKDFVPVTKAGATPNSWQINPNFPASTMTALIDMIRKEPGKYSIASPGTGTTPSLSIEMLRLALGLNFVVVPFSGGGPLVQSLLGGHTPIACSAIGNAMALIKDAKIRVLAITANKRVEFAPEIPTLDELGIKNQEAETMTGVFVPAGTPKPIVDLLQKEISALVTTPEVKAQLLELGVVPGGESSAEFADYVKAEVAKWRKVITEAKIAPIGG
jgi:tripartite-type tricarboxylate transporter receptor subunit TctC